MSRDQVSDLTQKQTHIVILILGDSYNIVVRISRRLNNACAFVRRVDQQGDGNLLFRRRAKQHRPKVWPEFLQLVNEIATTV